MKRKKSVLVCCVALLTTLAIGFLFSGCLGLDDDNDNNPTVMSEDKEEAINKCQDLVGWGCFKAETCMPTIEYNDCYEKGVVTAQCQKAVAWTEDYWSCNTEMNDLNCYEYEQGQIPASCETAIVLEGEQRDNDDGGDDDGGGNSATGNPVDLCYNYVEELCGQMAGCAPDGEQRETIYNQCYDAQISFMRCEDATGVSSTYDFCIDAIHNLTCDEQSGYVLEECTNVIEW